MELTRLLVSAAAMAALLLPAAVVPALPFLLAAQTDVPTAEPPDGVYPIGGGVTPPRLLSKVEPKYTEEARAARHQGTTVLSVVIGPDGFVRESKIVRSLGMGLDEKAIEAVRQWRFTPGQKNGRDVAVRASIEVNFRLLDEPAGQMRPAAPGGTAAPKVVRKVEPGYTEAARQAKISGAVALDVEVGVDGRARDIRVVRSLDAGLDQKAIEAVLQWEFAPATNNGQPVAARARIEINFRLN
jgi:TonB family protein